jgi:predicted nucleotide-binding protein
MYQGYSQHDGEMISEALRKGSSLLSEEEPHQAHNNFMNWVDNVAAWLSEGRGWPALSAEWLSLPVSQLVSGANCSNDSQDWRHFRDTVRERLRWLAEHLRERSVPESTSFANKVNFIATSENNRVFIVHGHNDYLREAVARFVEKAGLEAVILQEQPNVGRTIIEKFEQSSDAAFAIVLATADDEGRKRNINDEELRPRARQNVILELGFFIGRLGRKHVSLIYERGVELPSDYSGVAYIEFDGRGAWKTELSNELIAARLPLRNAR